MSDTIHRTYTLAKLPRSSGGIRYESSEGDVFYLSQEDGARLGKSIGMTHLVSGAPYPKAIRLSIEALEILA